MKLRIIFVLFFCFPILSFVEANEFYHPFDSLPENVTPDSEVFIYFNSDSSAELLKGGHYKICADFEAAVQFIKSEIAKRMPGLQEGSDYLKEGSYSCVPNKINSPAGVIHEGVYFFSAINLKKNAQLATLIANEIGGMTYTGPNNNSFLFRAFEIDGYTIERSISGHAEKFMGKVDSIPKVVNAGEFPAVSIGTFNYARYWDFKISSDVDDILMGVSSEHWKYGESATGIGGYCIQDALAYAEKNYPDTAKRIREKLLTLKDPESLYFFLDPATVTKDFVKAKGSDQWIPVPRDNGTFRYRMGKIFLMVLCK